VQRAKHHEEGSLTSTYPWDKHKRRSHFFCIFSFPSLRVILRAGRPATDGTLPPPPVCPSPVFYPVTSVNTLLSWSLFRLCDFFPSAYFVETGQPCTPLPIVKACHSLFSRLKSKRLCAQCTGRHGTTSRPLYLTCPLSFPP